MATESSIMAIYWVSVKVDINGIMQSLNLLVDSFGMGVNRLLHFMGYTFYGIYMLWDIHVMGYTFYGIYIL